MKRTTAEAYLLESLPVQEEYVRHGDVFELHLTSESDDSIVVWQFQTKSYDIGFSVLVDGLPTQVHSARYGATVDRMIEGKYNEIQQGCNVTLKWDNSYSLMRGKQILYRATIVSSQQFHSAKMALLQEMESQALNRKDSIESIEDDFEYPPQLTLEPTEKSKSQILATLERAVEDIVSVFISNPDVSIHENAIRPLIVALEQVLSHGLLKIPATTKLLLSPRAKEETKSRWTENMYWELLRETPQVVRDDHNVTEMITQYEPLPNARYIGWGRGRAMLFQLLNQNLLVKVLENLFKRDVLMAKYYSSDALIRDYESASIIVGYISALHGVNFNVALLERDFEGQFPMNLIFDISKSPLEKGKTAYCTPLTTCDTSSDFTTFTDCSAARFLLHSEPCINEFVKRGESIQVPVLVNCGGVVAWQFQLNTTSGIRFSVEYKGFRCLSTQRLGQIDRWYEGLLFVPENDSGGGMAKITFDNSSAYIRGREITYRIVAVDRKGYIEACSSALDAARAISWRIVMERAIPRVEEENQKKKYEEHLLVQQHLESKEALEAEQEEGGSLERRYSLFSSLLGWEQYEGENECTQCMASFSLFRRKHECESCLKAFCLSCSRHYVDKIGESGVQQRVCDRCFIKHTDELKKSTTTSEDSKECRAFAELKSNPAYSKYFKMLSVGVPHPAVARKMMEDSCDAASIAIFQAGPSGGESRSIDRNASATSSQMRKKSAIKRSPVGPRLRKVHWTALDERRAENSVWTRQTELRQSVPVQITARDISQLQLMFGERPKEIKVGGKKKPVARVKKGPVRLLDARRSNNVSIALNQFKSLGDAQEIGRMIQQVDWTVLTTERLVALQEIMPTNVEARRLQNYRGNVDQLGQAERFLLEMSRIPRVDAKVGALVFASQFESHMRQLKDRILVIRAASEEILQSEKLARLLELMLVVGNALNAGTERGNAIGITLDSIAKISDTRSIDRRITILDFIVKLAIDRGEGEILTFGEELIHVSQATRVANTICASQYKGLVRGAALLRREYEMEAKTCKQQHQEAEVAKRKRLELLYDSSVQQRELKLMRAEDKTKSIPTPTALPSVEKKPCVITGNPRASLLNELKAENPRASLLNELKMKTPRAERGKVSEKPSLMASLLGEIKGVKKKRTPQRDKENEISSNPKDYIFVSTPYVPNHFIQAMESLLPDLSLQLDQMEHEVELMRNKCDELAEYFGESTSSCTSQEICRIIDNFRRDINHSRRSFKARTSSSTLGIRVGHHLPTQYGPGTVAEIRNQESYRIQYQWGYAILTSAALLLPGDYAHTPYGIALIHELRPQEGFCVTRYDWGHAVLATRFVTPCYGDSRTKMKIKCLFTNRLRIYDPIETPFGPALVRSVGKSIVKVIQSKTQLQGFIQEDNITLKYDRPCVERESNRAPVTLRQVATHEIPYVSQVSINRKALLLESTCRPNDSVLDECMEELVDDSMRLLAYDELD